MRQDKTREMIRSILPSKARKWARWERKRIHRVNRHQVKQAIRDTANIIDDEGIDDAELVSRIRVSDVVRNRDVRNLVRDRREADKISHFIRWCKARITHIDKDDLRKQYYTVAGLVGGPKDVIREHALGHFLNPRYDFNPHRYRSYMDYSAPVIFTKEVFSKALQKAFESSKHYLLNNVCKNHYYRECRKDDTCVSTTYYSLRVFRYRKYRWSAQYYESVAQPAEGDYIPGTLSLLRITKQREHHDNTKCQNRILLQRPEDVSRLVGFIFGNMEEWKYGLSQGSLVKKLCQFFVIHSFMFDYLALRKE